MDEINLDLDLKPIDNILDNTSNEIKTINVTKKNDLSLSNDKALNLEISNSPSNSNIGLELLVNKKKKHLEIVLM